MEQLRKIGAIGGAISLALCWPLAVGQIGQNAITDGIATLNSSSIQAEIVDYDRGYFSSNVKTRITVVDESLKEQLEIDGLPSEYIVNSDVSHGLIGLDALSTLEDQPNLPLTLTTSTELNGNTSFNLELSQLNHQGTEENATSVSITKSTVSGHATVLGQIDYKLDIPSIQIDFPSGEEMTLSNLQGVGEGKQAKGYWLGTQNFTIESFAVTDATMQPYVSIENSQYDFESHLDEATKRLRSNLKLNIASIQTSDGEVNNLNVDFEMDKLDSQSFEKVFEIYQSNPVLTQEDIEQIIPYIDTLFAKGFDLSMKNISLDLGEGEFQSKWLVSVPEGTENISSDPSLIIPALTGDISSSFSNELVQEYPFIQEGIDELMVMEMIKQTDTGYEIHAALENGNLVFENGQEIPLIALLMPALMQ
ncbi:DUF945 family protein [Vibrio sp. D404a]|uniref:DUF945 family protein n=1 Tax=unclassified Vibrio TaxID=2614977 RepID=UPI0025523F8F|nr:MULTISPECIES: DUF945 family protein [unclassified Vibrio]MDK9738962.1 DUF945 family protein [Vibrio sp. D404a]MDK9799498.1 DUF945 family protein [Vibrio sp. D449a]